MQLISQIANIASLSGLDSAWQKALQTSSLVGIGGAFKESISKLDGDTVRKAGSFLQLLGFAVTLVLFAALGMHYFVNDKILLGEIALTGFALWLTGYLLGGNESRRANAIDITVLIFFATNIVATFASHYLMPSVDGLAKLVIFVCSYFYLSAVLQNSPKRKLIVVSWLVLMGVVQSLYGFQQFINHVQPLATWEDPTVESQGTRIFGWLDNPNLLAGYLIPICPLALALGFSALSARKFLLAALPLIAAAIICVAIVLTGSRGGYLAIAGAAASISFMAVARLWIAKPKARIFIIVLCVAIPILLLLGLHFVPSFEQRVTSIFAGREHSSNSYRINVWIASWRMFLDNWWIGIGPGNKTFRLAYGLYMVSGFDALVTYCVPLEVAVESGVVGLLACACMLIALFARAHISFWSSNANPADKSLSLEQWLTAGATAAIVGLLAQGMVDTVFYRPQVDFIFWLVVALIVTDDKGSKTIRQNS